MRLSLETGNWNLLDRPVVRQIFTYVLILRVVGMRFAQPFQRRDDFLLADFQCVGDHTRGLFEAEASIAVSAAHALQHVNILIIFRHSFLFLTCRGKADFLPGDQFNAGLRRPVLAHDHTGADKDAPRFLQREHLKYNKGVLGHESWRLMAMNQRPKSNLPALIEF